MGSTPCTQDGNESIGSANTIWTLVRNYTPGILAPAATPAHPIGRQRAAGSCRGVCRCRGRAFLTLRRHFRACSLLSSGDSFLRPGNGGAAARLDCWVGRAGQVHRFGLAAGSRMLLRQARADIPHVHPQDPRDVERGAPGGRSAFVTPAAVGGGLLACGGRRCLSRQ